MEPDKARGARVRHIRAADRVCGHYEDSNWGFDNPTITPKPAKPLDIWLSGFAPADAGREIEDDHDGIRVAVAGRRRPVRAG